MHGLFTSACVLLASVGQFVAAANSAGCGKGRTLQNGQHSMQVNGKQRNYFVHAPDNYDQNKAHRVVYLWHQLGGSAQKIVNGENPNAGGVLPFYGLKSLSGDSTIYVTPDGLGAGWGNQGGEDVKFFDQLVETTERDLCINTDLRFSTGFSYGGGMSYALACARPDKIRGVAIISGAQLSGCEGGAPSKPVAWYQQHGQRDSVLNIQMGRQLRDNAIRVNGCQSANVPQPQPGRSVKVNYTGCKAGFPVTYVEHTGDHNPSEKDGNTIFAPGNTWDFIKQFN